MLTCLQALQNLASKTPLSLTALPKISMNSKDIFANDRGRGSIGCKAKSMAL